MNETRLHAFVYHQHYQEVCFCLGATFHSHKRRKRWRLWPFGPFGWEYGWGAVQSVNQEPSIFTANLRNILGNDVQSETEWLEIKITRDGSGRIPDKTYLKMVEDLDPPYGTFVFKTIYTNEGINSSTFFVNPDAFITPDLYPPQGRKLI